MNSCFSAFFFVLLCTVAITAAKSFVHPGTSVTINQLETIKSNVKTNTNPWASWYSKISGYKTYNMQGPFETVTRNPTVNLGQLESDMNAVEALAYLWFIEQDSRWAEKALSIFVSWATKNTYFGGIERPWIPAAGFAGINGAEILRATYANYTSTTHAILVNWVQNVWKDALPFSKSYQMGAAAHLWGGNQGTMELYSAAPMSVFLDDWTFFNQTVNALLSDPRGGLPDTLPTGQVGDTGRDTGHGANQQGWPVDIAIVMWNQGVDVFSSWNNRIGMSTEHLARWMLYGGGVANVTQAPFEYFGNGGSYYFTWPDFDGNTGRFLYEIYQAKILYESRGITMPYSTKLLEYKSYSAIITINTSTPVSQVSAWVEPATIPISVSNLTIARLGLLSSTGYYSIQNDILLLSSGSNSMTWENPNGWVYAYKPVTGDAVITAKITSGWGQIMITDKVEAAWTTRYSRVLVKSGEVSTFWPGGSESYGGIARYVYQDSRIDFPWWIKVVRRGNFMYTWFSANNKTWSPSTNVLYSNLPETMYAGVAVFSGNATFTDVRIGTANTSRPLAPVAFSVNSYNSSVYMTWQPQINSVYFWVYCSFNGSNFDLVKQTPDSYFIHSNLSVGLNYSYFITPVGFSGPGLYSTNTIAITVTNDPVPTSQPSVSPVPTNTNSPTNSPELSVSTIGTQESSATSHFGSWILFTVAVICTAV